MGKNYKGQNLYEKIPNSHIDKPKRDDVTTMNNQIKNVITL